MDRRPMTEDELKDLEVRLREDVVAAEKSEQRAHVWTESRRAMLAGFLTTREGFVMTHERVRDVV